MTKAKTARCTLRSEVVRNRIRELGYTQERFFTDCGLFTGSKRTFDYWLKEDPNRRPSVADAGRIAEKFGLGLEEIAYLPDAVRISGSDAMSDLLREESRLRRLAIFGGLLDAATALRATLSFETTYLRYIGLGLPLRGFVRKFEHTERGRRQYGEISVVPSGWRAGTGTGQRRYIISYYLQKLRIDYGEVQLDEDGSLHLVTYFSNERDTAAAAPNGAFRIWTWFDKDPCRFTLRCLEGDFSITLDTSAGSREFATKGPDVVCFRAAPHQQCAGECGSSPPRRM